MVFWRVWAALPGSSLMIGETIRSWGQGRATLLFYARRFLRRSTAGCHFQALDRRVAAPMAPAVGERSDG